MILLLLIAATFHECRVSVGQVQSCKATGFTGEAQAEHNGTIRVCQVSAGKVSRCGHPYTGWVVMYRDEKHQQCRVESGTVFRCKGVGFTGTVVLPR